MNLPLAGSHSCGCQNRDVDVAAQRPCCDVRLSTDLTDVARSDDQHLDVLR
jgi:hypothetical protein